MAGHRKGISGSRNCCMLKDINPGGRAVICRHHAKGAVRQRLLDLGFVPQTEVEVIRRAPLGDPIECMVANYNVALRKSEADTIEVECD